MSKSYNMVYMFDGMGKTKNFEAENEFYADQYARSYCRLMAYEFVSIEEITLH